MCSTICDCGQEYGKCDICGKEANLERTYFHYNIPCECCGDKEDGKDMHFELVCHCKDCIPDIPKYITPILKDKIGDKRYRIKIKGMLPYKIDGKFCIQHNCTKKHIKEKLPFSCKVQDFLCKLGIAIHNPFRDECTKDFGCCTNLGYYWLRISQREPRWKKKLKRAVATDHKIREYASSYSKRLWDALMEKYKNKECNIGLNDVSDYVMNAIIDALENLSFNQINKIEAYNRCVEKEKDQGGCGQSNK